MVIWVSLSDSHIRAVLTVQGAISVGVKGVNSLGGMVAFRIALGLVEAGFFPGVMLLLSCWYKVSKMATGHVVRNG